MYRQTGQVASQLFALNDRWWDWRVASYDGWTLRLIADNDLTYHREVEVRFEGVAYMSLPTDFHHPVFRDPTAHETRAIRSALQGDLDQVTIFAWDIDADGPGRACLLAAHSARVSEESGPPE